MGCLTFILALFISYLPSSFVYAFSDPIVHTGGLFTTLIFCAMFGDYAHYKGDNKKSVGIQIFGILALLNVTITIIEVIVNNSVGLSHFLTQTEVDGYVFYTRDMNVVFKFLFLYSLMRIILSYIVFKVYKMSSTWKSVEQEYKRQREESVRIAKEKEVRKEQAQRGELAELSDLDSRMMSDHPDLPLSELREYIKTKRTIEEIERLILEILNALNLPSDTLMIMSRSANMARRMNVKSSEFYANIESAIGSVPAENKQAVEKIKQLAMEAVIIEMSNQK